MKTAASLILLTILYSSSLLANDTSTEQEQEQWYQADIVIFRNEATKNMTNEAWPKIHFRAVPPEAIQLTPVTSPTTTYNNDLQLSQLFDMNHGQVNDLDIQVVPFIELPDSEHLLNDKATTLDQSPNYTVLLKMAWRLPKVSDNQVRPVVIESAQSNDSTFFIHGLISIDSKKHLHANVDLWYSEVKPEESPLSSTNLESKTLYDHTLATNQEPRNLHLSITRNFQLKEKRIIQRISDTQYFDGPIIGMLLKLTPYERPDDQPPPTLEKKDLNDLRLNPEENNSTSKISSDYELFYKADALQKPAFMTNN
ncbi:MAG: CsiV family protein [Candidatus Endonucleobacter sp. (ex Gigantidas childressi)]|nr:CsiV family protein [Candidatus Endonucleobacter sp. (ex Gigantidas childressi)]